MPKDPNALAKATAASWNKPGGGYDKWKAGDAAREKAMPVGTMLPQAPVGPEKSLKANKIKKVKASRAQVPGN